MINTLQQQLQVTTIDETRTTNSIVRPISATVIGNRAASAALTEEVCHIDVEAVMSLQPTIIQTESDWAASLNRMAANQVRLIFHESLNIILQKRTYSVASSGSSLGGDICRICHCEATHDCPLLTPCHCSGCILID